MQPVRGSFDKQLAIEKYRTQLLLHEIDGRTILPGSGFRELNECVKIWHGNMSSDLSFGLQFRSLTAEDEVSCTRSSLASEDDFLGIRRLRPGVGLLLAKLI
jgi:hypothetical protein